MPIVSVLSIGEAANRFPGVKAWHVRRLFERGILPEPPRLSGMRVIPLVDLPKIEAALKNAGYLRSPHRK